MDIYVYSDESGVFDIKTDKFYIYAGLIFLDKKTKDKKKNNFTNFEKSIKRRLNVSKETELKGCNVNPKIVNRIFDYFNDCIKFCCIIDIEDVLEEIRNNKFHKQRFLDYAYKMGLKNCILQLKSQLNVDEVKNIYMFLDERNTATSGYYSFKETILKEFKYGKFNYEYGTRIMPLFPNLDKVDIKYVDSSNSPLVRGADMIANKIYKSFKHNKHIDFIENKVYIKYLPKAKHLGTNTSQLKYYNF